MLVNKFKGENEFTVKGNLINTSSTKYKRVTWSSLASKICGTVDGLDLAYVIAATLKIIIDQRNLPEIPIILCTDSKSLYEYVMKLGITKKKRLIIDIIAIRQAYEKRELFEIRHIDRQDNPIDTITKLLPNKALEKFVDTNELTIRMQG
jgi:hypothetical protein